MSLYRCSACGSPNVVTDSQNEGFNYLKGAIGTAVLGPGGAVAGINGKKATVFKCPDCGLTMSKPMNYETQMLIDAGVRNHAARTHLTLRGLPIAWEELKSLYKNIESGLADKQECSLQQQLCYDYTSKEGKKFLDELRDLIDFFAEEEKMREEIEKQQEEEKRIQKLADLANEKAALVARIEELTKEYKIKNEEFNSLGFFKFSEKRAIRKRLEQITQEGQEAEAKLDKTEQSIDYYENDAPSSSSSSDMEEMPETFSDEELIDLYGKEKAKEYRQKEREDWEKRQYGNSVLKYRIMAIFRATLRAMTHEQLHTICQYYWSESYSTSKHAMMQHLRMYQLDGIISKAESGAIKYFILEQ